MARIAPWMVGVKDRERERAKAEKAKTVWVIVKHSSGNGYVVRKGERLENGRIYLPSPYTDAKIEYESKSEKLADRKADSLNGF